MRKFLALLALPAVLLMTSCKDKEVTVNGEKVVLEEGLYGFFKTTQGDIVVKFEDKKAPMTTANFIALAEGRHEDVSEEYKGKPFYDGLKFHRVIPKFMAQTGDPDSRNAKPGKNLGNGGPGYTMEAEIVDTLIHKKGALAAARLGNDSNPEKRSSGSQFYVVQGRVFKKHEIDLVAENSYQAKKMTELQRYLYKEENKKLLQKAQYYQSARMSYKYDSLIRSIEPIIEERLGEGAKTDFTEKQINAYTTIGGAPHLDGGYTVFGEIVEGLNVLDSICGVERNNYDRPKKDVIILKATRVKK